MTVRKISFHIFALFLATLPAAVFAVDKGPLLNSLEKTGGGPDGVSGPYDIIAGSKYTALSEITGGLLFALSSLIGTIFLALTVQGGYKWMQARGEETEVKEALGTIRHGIIGMAIVLGAHLILKFVLDALLTSTST